jgi:hypothetical protein
LFRNPEEGQGSQRAVVPVMMMMMIKRNGQGTERDGHNENPEKGTAIETASKRLSDMTQTKRVLPN